jgi:hypothetical protein
MLSCFRVIRDVSGRGHKFVSRCVAVFSRSRCPLLNYIFQRGVGGEAFNMEEFAFVLIEEQADLDIFSYRVSSGDHFNELLFCFGVDASGICGPRSNVDFVHFVWENFERFYFRRYSLVLVPSSASLPPEARLVCLKY